MSQIKIKTKLGEKEVEVVGGWDHPCRNYHLTVFNLDPEALEETLWCQLDHFPLGQPDNMEVLKGRLLLDLGMQLPELFWTACSRKEGNQIYNLIKFDNDWSLVRK